MSFSQNVKKEILSNIKRIRGCDASAFLVAVLKSIGYFNMDGGFGAVTDNSELLQFAMELYQAECGTEDTLFYFSASENGIFSFSCRSEISPRLGLMGHSADGLQIFDVPQINLDKPCCLRAFMQGLFLSCGSVTVPEPVDEEYNSEHANYHLELRFSNEVFAHFVQEKFAMLDFKFTYRKHSTILYLKDSNKIADFFVYVDAVNAKFHLENIIIARSFRNDANRQSNCIYSNIGKAIKASSKHLEAIQKIRQSGMFDTLPQQLKDVVLVREQNPEANLSELAAALNISKSGTNHRLAKLISIAEDIK